MNRRQRSASSFPPPTMSPSPMAASRPAPLLPGGARRHRRRSSPATRWRSSRSPPAQPSSNTPRRSAAPREDIAPGEHVHSHNLVFEAGRLPVVPPSEAEHATEADRARTFMGYRRADGRAGTRNFIGIIASVNCSTTVCRAIADAGQPDLAAAISRHRRLRADRPRPGLRHERHRRRHDGAAPHARRLCPPSEFRRRADGRPRLRGQPAHPLRPEGRRRRQAAFQHPGCRRLAQIGREAMGVLAEIAEEVGQLQARADPGQRDRRRPAMRRLRRHVGHHRQPGAGRGRRHPGRRRRHRHPVRDDGNLRRRTSARAPRRHARDRRRSSTAM